MLVLGLQLSPVMDLASRAQIVALVLFLMIGKRSGGGVSGGLGLEHVPLHRQESEMASSALTHFLRMVFVPDVQSDNASA